MHHLKSMMGLVVALVAVACLCSCSGDSGATQTDLAGADRGASSVIIPQTGDRFVKQHGTFNRPGEFSPDGHIIAPGGDDDLAWAKYKLAALSSDRPVNVSIEAMTVIAPGGDDDLPLVYWLLVYNYSRNAWDTRGPYEQSTSIVLNSDLIRSRYVSADDELNFMVLTDCSGIEPDKGNPEGLTAVEIVASATEASTDYVSTIPMFPQVTDLFLGADKGASDLDPDTQYVTLEWEHYVDSDDWKNEAMRYEVWRRVDGTKTPMLMGKVDAPTSVFVDPTDIQPGSKHAVPGATYYYYVQSINIGGKTPLAMAGPITIPFYPPTELAASDGDYADQIVLTWTKAEGAEGYEIYRDSQDEPVATVGDVDTWADTTLDDYDEHVYWLKSVNEYATSGEFSLGDKGYRAK